MNNGNISKKPMSTNIYKNTSKSKVPTESNKFINVINNLNKKDENDMIFKDISPMMFNRSKNNFYSKEIQKGKINKIQYLKSDTSNLKGQNNNFMERKSDLFSSKIISNTNNINVNCLLQNSQKNTNLINLNINENFSKKLNNNINANNLIDSSSKIILSNSNNFIENNTKNVVNESLKRELELIKTELHLANLKLKEKDKKLDLLENQMIKQKEENENLKNEIAELKKKFEERNQNNEIENEEFPAFYRRRNLIHFNEMINDFIKELHGNNGNDLENQNIINQLYPDPDNMTYEQLLELQEKIGYVSKGISKEEKELIPTKIFDKRKLESKSNTACTICLGDFQDKEKLNEIQCGHQFHLNCLDEWLNNEKVCPICKNEVL